MRANHIMLVDASPKHLVTGGDDPLLGHRLATALFLAGRVDEAERQFVDVARQSPGYAPAHYSLGVLLESRGRVSDEVHARRRRSPAIGDHSHERKTPPSMPRRKH